MTDMEVFEKLATLQWLIRRHQMAARLNQDPLSDGSRGQGRILAMLKIQPEISTKDLGYLLGIRQWSLNELLNKLEKGGYVEHRPSEKDRRVMIVHLTEKGREVEQQEPEYPGIFEGLNDQELEAFAGYLDFIINTLKEKAGNDPVDMREWVMKMRKTMGEERFHALGRIRGGMPGMAGRRFGPEDLPGAERFSPDYDGPVPDRDRFAPFRRGQWPFPGNMPGAERFSPDYDGPVPDKDESPPFGMKRP